MRSAPFGRSGTSSNAAGHGDSARLNSGRRIIGSSYRAAHSAQRSPGSAGFTHRVRLLAVALGGVLLSGCATQWEPPRSASVRTPPAPRGEALVSSYGEESGLKIVSVRGLQAPPQRQPGLGAVDAPAAVDTRMGFWLTPGRHVLSLQYVRNIATGISLMKADLPVTVQAGRTYVLRAVPTTDFGKSGFTLVDYGGNFPVRCLPWSIREAQVPDARGERRPFTRQHIDACRARFGR